MFTFLYNTVFPLIDRFFATLSAFALMPFRNVIDFLTSSETFTVTVAGFTGNTWTIQSYKLADGWLGGILDWLVNGFGSLMGISDMPFVFALLTLLAECFVFLLFAKFLLSIVTKIL